MNTNFQMPFSGAQYQTTKCCVIYHEVTDISYSPGLRNGAQYGNGFRIFVSVIVPPPSRWGFRTNWSGAAKAIATVLSPSGPLRQQQKRNKERKQGKKKMLQCNHFTLTLYVWISVQKVQILHHINHFLLALYKQIVTWSQLPLKPEDDLL